MIIRRRKQRPATCSSPWLKTQSGGVSDTSAGVDAGSLGGHTSTSVVTSSGTATDVGSIVAGVEISVDGGMKWRTMMSSSRPFQVLVGVAAVALIVTLVGVRPDAQSRGQGTPAAAPPGPCATPRNKIIAENCKPGHPREEWDVHSLGDPDIQGFATNMSVNLGEDVEFKIKTHSPKYRLDLYRMGWYGGSGARLIETIRPSVPPPQAQPDCIIHPNVRMVECGNWKVSASWRVPSDGVSGVYVARLVREDDEPESWRSEGNSQRPAVRPAPTPHNYGAQGTGKLRDAMKEKRASHIIFVVRDDAGRSDILFQTSDPAWVAANRYGGSSLNGSWPATIMGAAAANPQQRGFKVSYNRPLVNRDGFVTDQFFSAEYPAVRWLERNGYDVSYFAGVDSDRRGEKIKEHKVFVSAGHDAYWSGTARRHVEAARDAGVNLAFMSGNAVFWKTRYESSTEGSSTPYRTLVSYKETYGPGRVDPHRDAWTGAWRDSRPMNPEGAKPENALMGTISTVGATRNDRLNVPASYGKLRFWRNTDVTALKDEETAVLGRGILGPEWDEDLDNGFRPRGLIRLSETTVDGVPYVQDWGTVYDSGTATHSMTLYRAPSGALVFSAGTPQYAWGLDNLHTYWTASGRVRPEPMGPVKAIQQATVNLLADMGVRPANLQRDLKPAEPSLDKTAPLSKISAPVDGAVVDGVVTITGVATDSGGGVVAGVEVSTDSGETWHPAGGTQSWSYEWKVPGDFGHATILSRATDDSNQTEPVGAGVQVRGPVFRTR